MSGCQECDSSTARTVRVTFTNNSNEKLELCNHCVNEYEDGGLVSSVSMGQKDEPSNQKAVDQPTNGTVTAAETGGEPTKVVECAECGEVYPAQAEAGGRLRPIGGDRECRCGNDAFDLLTDL